MLRAADYRERARASLSGNWGMAVLVCFVGALLGGIQSVIPVTANYQYGEGMSVQIFGINMSLNQLPAEMLGILAVMMSILSIYALAQFVIGGVVELGMCAYFSKRALGENADIKDEFAYFQYFGKALGLRIVTSIFIFLWTMLFIIPGSGRDAESGTYDSYDGGWRYDLQIAYGGEDRSALRLSGDPCVGCLTESVDRRQTIESGYP